MANFRLKSPDCVFIHITKTGGTSIRKGVWRSNYDPPAFGHMPDDWKHLFKFAFVRHPLDRFVSAYKMFTEGTKGAWFVLPADARPLTVSEFIDIVLDETIIYDERRKSFEERIRHHAIPQTHPFNCLHHADFVGRFETLQKDFERVAVHLGLTCQLPHMHYAQRGEWNEYLSGRDMERLVCYYAEDIARLGYEV